MTAARQLEAPRPLLEVRDLHVYLGQSHVLQGVSFGVPDGGVTALLGRNGVGKTTTIRAILGLTSRSGSIRYDGNEVSSVPTHRIVRRSIGYVPEDRDVFAGLTVTEVPPSHCLTPSSTVGGLTRPASRDASGLVPEPGRPPVTPIRIEARLQLRKK